MQHEYRDEVRSRLSALDNIHDKVHTLHTYIQHNIQHDPRGCAELASEALVLSRQTGDRHAIAQSLTDLGRCHQLLNEYSEARLLYGEALAIFDGLQDYAGQVLVLRNMAWISRVKGEYTSALDAYTRAMVHAEAHGLSVAMAQCLNGLGTLYGAMGDYSKAIECYQRSLHLRGEAGDKELGAVYTNIGNMHHRLGNYREALEYYQRRLDLCGTTAEGDAAKALTLQNVGATLHQLGDQEQAEAHTRQALEIYEKLGDKMGVARCLANVGCILQMRNELDAAAEMYQRAMKIASEAEDHDTLTGTLTNLGTLYTASGAYSEAVGYLLQALAMAENAGSRKIQSEICMHLSEAFEKAGDHAEALSYYKLYSSLNNELLGREKHMAMHELQYKFDIEKLEQEKEIYRLKNVELAQALGDVENLNSHLRQMDAEKSELLGIVVHDLKSPLSNILMLAQLLSRNYTTIKPADISEFAGDIETVAHRMMELIVNLLDADSMESGQMHLAPAEVEVVDVVTSVLALYRERAAAKSIIIHANVPDSAYALADCNALARAVDNLVSNAIKYSPPDCNIYVKVWEESDSVCCSVRDEGPGMTEEDKEKLFGRFARLSARPTGGEHSTGLGLSIVKKLMEAMHGNVHCESEYGRGCAFILELPKSGKDS